MRRRKGFTLIELLVVIAIIAILAAILFPMFTLAKRSAFQTTCANNLTQFHRAFMLYAGDWEGRLPLPAVAPSNSQQCMCWLASPGYGSTSQAGAIYKYLRTGLRSGDTTNLWSCPFAIRVPFPSATLSPGSGYVMNQYLRDAHPGELGFNLTTPNFFIGMLADAPRSPSRVILLYEGVQDANGGVDRQGSPFYTADYPPYSAFGAMGWAYIAQNWHHGKSNWLFLDGHVRLLSANETWTKELYSQYGQSNRQFAKWTKIYKGWGSVDLWNPQIPEVHYP